MLPVELEYSRWGVEVLNPNDKFPAVHNSSNPVILFGVWKSCYESAPRHSICSKRHPVSALALQFLTGRELCDGVVKEIVRCFIRVELSSCFSIT